MKLTVTQENLSKALASVGRVASSKTSLPVLNNILIKTDKNRLLLASTNLELAITEHIGAKVTKEGSLTIPARLAIDFVHNLPKGNVELEVEGTKLHIKNNHYKSTINGIAADEFPSLPQINTEHTYEIDSQLLSRAIQQTVIVASKDETRQVLTGIFCHSYEGKLYFAATDGYRLAERSIMPISEDISAIIPAQTLQEVMRVINDSTQVVQLFIDDEQVRFLIGEIEITSRLIDGTFVDYRQLIPKQTDIIAKVSKEEFTRVTKIASLFAKESGGSVTIRTSEDDKTMSIHSVASQLGENTSSIPVSGVHDGQVTLNSRYLLEALSVIDETDISFSFSGKLAPCVVRGDQDNTTYTHIIMPLKS